MRFVEFMRRSLTDDGRFGRNESWKPLIRGVRGELETISFKERIFASREGVKGSHRLFVPRSPEIDEVEERDRVEIDGRLYEIVGMEQYFTHISFILEEVL